MVRPLFALLLAALTLIAPASAQKPEEVAGRFDARDPTERIISYASDIEVTRDGALNVAETIRVMAQGRDIRRGIYRDFPTRYRQGDRTVRVGFDFLGATRDGRAEPYHTERVDNGVRVYLGDADVLLPPGEHTYVIRYRTTRQLGFFADYDELYWNVTGNGWTFPVDSAQARVRLPAPAAFGRRAFYTGPEGSTDSNAEVVSERPGDILIRTTSGLGAYEGLTIAVAWPKGVVTPPAPPTQTSQWLERNGPIGAILIALAGLGAFYFYAWKRAGRGPVPGTVVPLFEPPEGMSAAAVRYVRRMGYDNRVFAAAIVDSGVRGKLRLDEGEKGWFSKAKIMIHKTAEPDDMPEPERQMLHALLGARSHIEMDKANHATFRAAQHALQTRLEAAYKGQLFLTNKGWAWVGLVFLLAAMLFVGAVVLAVDPYTEASDKLIPWAGLGCLLVAIGLGPIIARKGAPGWLALIFSVLIGIAGLFAFIGTISIASEGLGVLWILGPLIALPLVISAFWWMAAPTREGRAVMDRIAGFERYLSITEEDRLEKLHPPEKTPELFERYLPYAIALGVENRWAGKFAAVLAAAAADPNRQGRSYGWYSGSQNVWSNPGMFATAVGATLASSAAAASTAPGSSSGSGGGGSSGGGGGGGGGGGW